MVHNGTYTDKNPEKGILKMGLILRIFFLGILEKMTNFEKLFLRIFAV